MHAANVLKEILLWSMDRPPWQRDALRRLASRGELSTVDIAELAAICKGDHGLIESPVAAKPLSSTDLPDPSTVVAAVSLASLTHRNGVNALGVDQTIEFCSGITVVFGLNAAGKSGYTRILKRACRARGAEEILGNVVGGIAPSPPAAVVKFHVGDKLHEFVWSDDVEPNASLSRVSVFDRHCASVYVAEATDVAFRPLGLDLFDKLSNACEAVRTILEGERRALESAELRLPEVPAGTAAHAAILRLTSLTSPEGIRRLATVASEELARASELRAHLRDLQSDDPSKRAKTLRLQAARVEALAQRIRGVAEVISEGEIDRAFDARDHLAEATAAAEAARALAFGNQPLRHSGSQAWRALWAAAEQYSTADAYPEDSFPVTGPDSRCVLCQQKLREDGVERLQRFSEFLGSSLSVTRDRAAAEYQAIRERLTNVTIYDSFTAQAIQELQVDAAALAEQTHEYLRAAEGLRAAALNALTRSEAKTPRRFGNCPPPPDLMQIKVSLIARAEELQGASRPELIAAASAELRELDGRIALSRGLDAVLSEIERRKRVAVYQVCVEETRTTAITRKSSEVTKHAVTDQLTKAFSHELKSLDFKHVEVVMVPAGGSRGALYHKLQLRRAPGVPVPQVVSEGEARCLSIAAFFAELSTTDDRSAILFDDPVSSLDHAWRERVSARLAAEAKVRQVVVFTHDITFLRDLADQAENMGVEIRQYTLRRGPTAAGLTTPSAPFGAMNVKERVGYLKNAWQHVEKLYRENKMEEYERSATRLYALLRQAWERAVEELLLNGVVERYRNSVQTLKLAKLGDIQTSDCEAVEKGMTKSSKWEGGHDHANADGAPIPGPEELRADIEDLDRWATAMRKRR